MSRFRYPQYRSSSHHQHLPSFKVVLEAVNAAKLKPALEGCSRVIRPVDPCNHLDLTHATAPASDTIIQATPSTTSNVYPYAPSTRSSSNRVDYLMRTIDHRYSNIPEEEEDPNETGEYMDEEDDSPTIFEEGLEYQRPDSPTPTLRGHTKYAPGKRSFDERFDEATLQSGWYLSSAHERPSAQTSGSHFVTLANILRKVLTVSRQKRNEEERRD